MLSIVSKSRVLRLLCLDEGIGILLLVLPWPFTLGAAPEAESEPGSLVFTMRFEGFAFCPEDLHTVRAQMKTVPCTL